MSSSKRASLLDLVNGRLIWEGPYQPTPYWGADNLPRCEWYRLDHLGFCDLAHWFGCAETEEIFYFRLSGHFCRAWLAGMFAPENYKNALTSPAVRSSVDEWINRITSPDRDL